ncbi:hypothetical protein ACKVMT_10290 [Halobacteriales archaeon Cl-PHB]
MGDTGGNTAVEGPVAFDTIAEALGHQTRRQVLAELLEHNPLAIQDVVARNVGPDRDDARLQMVHLHLPKLDDMGYVSWDRDSETIVKGPNWDEIEPVLRLFDENGEQLQSDMF